MTTNPPPDARNARIYVAAANVAVMDILSGREQGPARGQHILSDRRLERHMARSFTISPIWPFLATVDDGGPDPIPRLSQCGVGQANQDRPDQPVRDICLDLDHLPGHPDQRHGVRAGQRHGYPTPRMCSTVNPPVPSYTRPTTSIRT